MAAERKKRHDEKMATINDQQDKQIAKLQSVELMKDKKAAVLVKENTTDIREKMQKQVDKVNATYERKKLDEKAFERDLRGKQTLLKAKLRDDKIKADEKNLQDANDQFKRDMDHFKEITKREKTKKMNSNQLMNQLASELEGINIELN